MPTAEQAQANEALREAVERACHAYGWSGGASLTEFVVAGVMSEDPAAVTEREHTRYFTLLSDDALPQHRVVGLLVQAQHFYL